MSLKMIAIGILVLVALSLLISSRAARAALGMATLAILVLIAAYSFGPPRTIETNFRHITKPPANWLDWRGILRIGRDWREVARVASQEAWNQVQDQQQPDNGIVDLDVVGEYDTSTNVSSEVESIQAKSPASGDLELGGTDTAMEARPRASSPPRFFVHKPIQVKKEMGEATFYERCANVIEQYLRLYSQQFPLDVGVSTLKPTDLNWSLVKWRVIGDPKGVAKATMVFDDQFHQHVRNRGREVLSTHRLKTATSVAFAVIGVLSLLLGMLKLISSRQTRIVENDLLLSNGVSMI